MPVINVTSPKITHRLDVLVSDREPVDAVFFLPVLTETRLVIKTEGGQDIIMNGPTVSILSLESVLSLQQFNVLLSESDTQNIAFPFPLQIELELSLETEGGQDLIIDGGSAPVLVLDGVVLSQRLDVLEE